MEALVYCVPNFARKIVVANGKHLIAPALQRVCQAVVGLKADCQDDSVAFQLALTSAVSKFYAAFFT